jgi:hypothetical protein
MSELDLGKAIERAMADWSVRSLKNYFLASVFSIIEENQDIREWTLLFYNPQSGKTRDCFVSEKFVTLSEEADAQKEMAKLDIKSVAIGVNEALKIAHKKFNKKIINILISLHTAARPLWTIIFVATDVTATSFDIDAASGSVVMEETTSLMRKEK